jgi:hypothetical protein
MIQANINNRSYFFTVNHVTKESGNKLLYNIRLNHTNYFISKTLGIGDGVQLDIKTPLSETIIKELNTVITAIELKYKKQPSLARINREIFGMLIRLRNLGFNRFKMTTA